MNQKQAAYVTKELKRQRDAALQKHDTKKYNDLKDVVKQFEVWQSKGRKGKCPVDYAGFGISLPQDEAAVILPKEKTAEKNAETSSAAESVANDAKKEEQVPAVVSEESSEMIAFRDELARAESLLASEDLLPALTLAQTLVESNNLPVDLQEKAKQLVNEAHIKREARIATLLELANKAAKDSIWDAAEKNYLQALALDEKDQRVLDGLNALYDLKSDAEQKKHLADIKINLQNQNEIVVLGTAIREAENLIARNKADDELLRLFKSGKVVWDKLREKHGQTTTKARIGTLEARAEAVHEYEQYIIRNQMKVWDATLNTYIDTQTALADARINWETFSHKETQNRLSEVEKSLPHNLDWAKQRLQGAINQKYYDREDEGKKKPLGEAFQENDRTELQARLTEIERLIENRNKAEALQEKSRNSTPEAALSLLIDAKGLWQYLEGIDSRIEEKRELVAGLVADHMNAKLREAQAALINGKFDNARKLAADAMNLSKQHPVADFKVIKSATQDVEKFNKQIKTQEDASSEFSALEKEVSKLLADPETRSAAFELFDKRVNKIAKFKGPRLDALRYKINANRDAVDQWEEIRAQEQAQDPNWNEINRLCEQLKNQAKSGEYYDYADGLQKLILGRQLIAQGDIRRAEEVLKEAVRKDKTRISEIQGYLEEIVNSKKNDSKIKPQMNRAGALIESPDLRKKLQAFQVFRDIAESEERSSFTLEAHSNANNIGSQLRTFILPRLEAIYQNIQNVEEDDEIDQFVSETALEEAANWASILREGNLAWQEHEKIMVRKIEIAFYRIQAGRQAQAGQWDMVVKTWEKASENWQSSSDIEIEARKARKQKAIHDARTALAQKNMQHALDLLREEQTKDNWGGDAELNYYLAEAYRGMEQFDDAERSAYTAQNDVDLVFSQKGAELLKLIFEGREISKVNKEVRDFKSRGDYESALELLKRLPSELADHQDINQIRDEVILSAQSELLKFAKKELAKGTGVVAAVESLVRLRGIENLSTSIESKAADELKQLRDQLPRSAKQVINSANNFTPSKMSLADALQEARRISNQLQAFLGIADDFPQDTWLELKGLIDSHLVRTSDKIERMEKIQGILGKIQVNGDAWKVAVSKDDFTVLKDMSESLKNVAGGSELAVLDIKEFNARLVETIELRRYISGQFRRIKEGENSLLAQEDYAEILKLCRTLQNLPDRSRVDNPQGAYWEKIRQSDYMSILKMADSDLNFFDEITEKFLSDLVSEQSPDLVDTLAILAAQRQSDIQKWEDWLPEAENLSNKMEASYKAAGEVFGGSVDVVKVWRKFQVDVEKAILYFATESENPSSNKVREYINIKDNALKTMLKWKEKSIFELDRHSECASKKPPTIEELKQLSRNENYFELAEGLIRAKFAPIDDNYEQFVLGLEGNRLRTLKDVSPINKLNELKSIAEKCLGPNDSLTIQIEQKINDLNNAPIGIFGKIFGRKNNSLP